MPRLPRCKSKSGIYHIMLRGINQQVIFEEKEDYERFIQTIKKYKLVSGYRIYGYCLMSNHIHLLLKVEKEQLDVMLKRIAGSYVYWYNLKYYRKGHLFQDRFRSEAVDDERYFLTVLRYIHQNPIKAGVVKDLQEYQYSSYVAYIDGMCDLVDIDYAYSLIPKDDFARFNNEVSDDKCLDIEEQRFRINDDDAKRIIKEISNCESSAEIQALDMNMRDRCIRECKKRGLSIRQISRLTGISFAIVRKIQI